MTDDHDPPYTVALNIGGPRDPRYVLEVAEAFAECIRVLNHLTRDHAALEYPAEADTLIRYLSRAAAMLPQLLGQVGAWLEQEDAAGRITVPAGEYRGNPLLAVASARLRLDMAVGAAAALRMELDNAAAVTTDLAGVPDGEEDDDG